MVVTACSSFVSARMMSVHDHLALDATYTLLPTLKNSGAGAVLGAPSVDRFLCVHACLCECLSVGSCIGYNVPNYFRFLAFDLQHGSPSGSVAVPPQ